MQMIVRVGTAVSPYKAAALTTKWCSAELSEIFKFSLFKRPVKCGYLFRIWQYFHKAFFS